MDRREPVEDVASVEIYYGHLNRKLILLREALIVRGAHCDSPVCAASRHGTTGRVWRRTARSNRTKQTVSCADITISHLMASVSWLSLLIEDHVFYLALGYFISYLPYALLAKGLSSGIVPGVDRPPGTAQFIAVAFVVGAVVARSYPALRANLGGTTALRERVVVLVCGGNQSRSAMAEWMAQAVMATTWSGHLVTIASAGVQVDTPGTPMTDAAYAVLQDAGVIPHRHRSRPLTADLCRHADAIYCMTAGHRAAVLALAPDVADRTHCVAEGDIPEPSATSVDDHRRTAALIRQAVRNRPAEQLL